MLTGMTEDDWAIALAVFDAAQSRSGEPGRDDYADTMAVGNGHMETGMQVMTKPFALETLAARVQGIIDG